MLFKASREGLNAKELKYMNISLKHSILGVLVVLAFMAFCLWLELMVVFRIALIPLTISIFNIYLSYRKKYVLAAYLAIYFFAVSIIWAKYYLLDLPLELFFIPMIIASFSIFDNIKWVKLSFVLLSILFGLAYYVGKITPNTLSIDLFHYSLFIYFIGTLLLVVCYQVLNNYFVSENHYRRDILEQKNKIEEQNEELIMQQESIIALEKEKNEKELELKQKDIETLQETNRLKRKIRQNTISDLQSIKSGTSAMMDIKAIILKLKQQVESEVKIEKMQQDMEVVNSQFQEKLIIEYPQLTKTEREICSYIKLGLSSKEMAELRYSNVNAIDVTKARIRKKMNINSSNELSQKLSII